MANIISDRAIFVHGKYGINVELKGRNEESVFRIWRGKFQANVLYVSFYNKSETLKSHEIKIL